MIDYRIVKSFICFYYKVLGNLIQLLCSLNYEEYFNIQFIKEFLFLKCNAFLQTTLVPKVAVIFLCPQVSLSRSQ